MATRQLELDVRDSLDDTRAELEVLAPAAQNVFGTHEWLSTWWRHFGRRRRLAVGVVRRGDGSPLAVLPAYLATAWPIPVLRLLGHGESDELGPVCAPQDREMAARQLGPLLARVGARAFVGDDLPADVGWARLLGGREVGREASPVLRLGGRSWDAVLATRSANLRQQAGRRERQLRRAHEVTFRLADARTLDRDLSTLFALHTARWRGPTSFRRFEAIQREFAGLAFARGWLRLWVLELDGRPVAAWHGFRFAGVESYYQSGRDPAWDHAAVGFVLLVHTLRAAAADGVEEYRFLRGGEPYKRRFADDDRPLVTVVTGGPVVRTAVELVIRAGRRRLIAGLVRRLGR